MKRDFGSIESESYLDEICIESKESEDPETQDERTPKRSKYDQLNKQEEEEEEEQKFSREEVLAIVKNAIGIYEQRRTCELDKIMESILKTHRDACLSCVEQKHRIHMEERVSFFDSYVS